MYRCTTQSNSHYRLARVQTPRLVCAPPTTHDLGLGGAFRRTVTCSSTAMRVWLSTARSVCSGLRRPHALQPAAPYVRTLSVRVPVVPRLLARPFRSVQPSLVARPEPVRAQAWPRYNVLRAYSSGITPAAPTLATRPIVAYHLLASAGLVFLIIIVGGITRLTESGLSITEWNPGLKGMRLPANDDEWNAEWAKYKTSPEFQLINQEMTLEDFKSIFMWEWSHRILGRVIGVFFAVPALYFGARRGITTPEVRWKLFAIAAGIGFQGLLGWLMVSSGLKNPYEDEPQGTEPRPDWTPRVSHFRLAAHLGAAFAVYMGMVYTAATILRDNALARSTEPGAPAARADALPKLMAQLENPAVRKYRRVAIGMMGLVCLTVAYGAFVAGLDAGLVYSEFPTMGEGRLLPPTDELLDARYAVRPSGQAVASTGPTPSRLFLGNVTQNPVTVQAIHRYLGLTTLASMVVFFRYTKRVRALLPSAVPRFAIGAVHMTAIQALLGITTLMYMVPLPLASMHQGGSVVVLTLMTCVLALLRKPGAALQTLHRARQHAATHTPTRP